MQQLFNVLTAKHYSPRTIRNYTQEMRFLFAHYPDVVPDSISQQDIINYINYIIKVHEVGREKCHQVAQSCSFFFKYVMPSPFIVPTALFKLLFDAASQTLLQFAKDPKYLGGKCSITTVLHTWGQQLGFHPHLHCIVSGGGVDDNNKWIAAKRKNDKFLFPVPAMKPVFKAIFLKGLRLLIQKDELQIKGIDTKNNRRSRV